MKKIIQLGILIYIVLLSIGCASNNIKAKADDTNKDEIKKMEQKLNELNDEVSTKKPLEAPTFKLPVSEQVRSNEGN